MRLWRWLVLSVLIAACRSEPSEPPIPEALAQLLADDVYAYFRFTNRDFAQRVCEELETNPGLRASVNLHGDAHLEQYAVMSEGRGLMDFDDSARGPALVDVTRFGVSVVLAAERNGWASDTDGLLEELWRGYVDALRDPEMRAPVPGVVETTRAPFGSDRAPFLESSESLMRPRRMTIDEVNPVLRFGLSLFVETLTTDYPEEGEAFFTVKSVGRLEMGIGSALSDKFLVRVEGPTPSATDDVVLEAKRMSALEDIDCIYRGGSDPFPVLIAQSQLAYRPYDYVGYVYFDPARAGEGSFGEDYWDGAVYIIHSWIDNYVELSVDHSFGSVEELREVVYDAGAQLGRGHSTGNGDALGRGALVTLADSRHDLYREIVSELSGEWMERWRDFRQRVE